MIWLFFFKNANGESEYLVEEVEKALSKMSFARWS